MIKRFSRYDLSRLLIPVAAALLLLTSGARGVDLRSGIANDGNGATVTDGFSGRLANATIRGYTFTSRGLILGGSSNVVITDCAFRDIPGRAIDHNGGLTDVTISNCAFTNVAGDAAIFGWNAVRTKIVRNRFLVCRQPVHQFWGGDRAGPDDCAILGNYVDKVAHFALELQGNPNGLEVAGNYVNSWVTGPSQMGFSVATGGDHGGIAETPPDTSHRVRVHHNFIGGDGLRSNTAQDQYAAIEFMGSDNSLTNNWVWGQWDCFALIGLNNPTAMVVRDNVTCGGPIRRLISGEDRYQPLAAGNLANNVRVADGTAPPTFAQVLAAAGLDPGGIAPATSRPAIADLSGKATAPGTIAWTWTPVPTPLHWRCQATRGTQVLGEGDLPAGAGSVSVPGIPAYWEATLSLSTGGAVLASSNVQYLSANVPAPTTQATAPTLLRTINVYSDGSVKVVEAGS